MFLNSTSWSKLKRPESGNRQDWSESSLLSRPRKQCSPRPKRHQRLRPQACLEWSKRYYHKDVESISVIMNVICIFLQSGLPLGLLQSKADVERPNLSPNSAFEYTWFREGNQLKRNRKHFSNLLLMIFSVIIITIITTWSREGY